MSKLKINHYVVGPVQTNCYFAINEETNELLVIDPGASAKQLAERIRQEADRLLTMENDTVRSAAQAILAAAAELEE